MWLLMITEIIQGIHIIFQDILFFSLQLHYYGIFSEDFWHIIPVKSISHSRLEHDKMWKSSMGVNTFARYCTPPVYIYILLFLLPPLNLCLFCDYCAEDQTARSLCGIRPTEIGAWGKWKASNLSMYFRDIITVPFHKRKMNVFQ